MGIIRVTATAKREIEATEAKLHLSVEGESLILGNAALERAKELRELVAALTSVGIKKEGIAVTGVHVSNQQGLLVKGQRATFSLTVKSPPERLPDALGVIAAQKHIELSHLEWVFDEFEASIGLAAEAMRMARRKGDAIAEAANTHITGISNASDSWQMPEMRYDFAAAAPAPQMARGKAMSAVNIGTDFTGTQMLMITLTVDFAVA